jgi:hypothetical protein
MSNMGEGPFARFARVKHPVARDEDLLVEHLEDETVVYDSRTSEAHCLSPLAAVVFAHSDGATTIEELAALATDRLGEPIDEPRVIDALAQLQDRDLLAVPPRDGLSRRQMIGKTAAAGGALVGASLITTIIAPTAIAASSLACGDFLCCPCCTSAGLNKNECCSGLQQCVCVDASTGGGKKFCVPSATGSAVPCEPGHTPGPKTAVQCGTNAIPLPNGGTASCECP